MLNLNQKTAVGITLGIVEDELCRLKGLLRQGEEESLFSHIRDDLNAGQKRLVEEKIEGLIEYLASLKNFFDLRHSHKEFTLSGIVKAMAIYLQVELENRMSNRLKGYGEVHPGLKETLDPKLCEMITILRQMGSIK